MELIGILINTRARKTNSRSSLLCICKGYVGDRVLFGYLYQFAKKDEGALLYDHDGNGIGLHKRG